MAIIMRQYDSIGAPVIAPVGEIIEYEVIEPFRFFFNGQNFGPGERVKLAANQALGQEHKLKMVLPEVVPDPGPEPEQDRMDRKENKKR